jgi:hypothetical protein
MKPTRHLPIVLATFLFSTAAGTVLQAQERVHLPINASFGHVKRVSFQVRNNTKEPMKIMAGPVERVLRPGQTIALKLAVGEKLLSAQASANYPAGSVIVTASSELSDATVVLN